MQILIVGTVTNSTSKLSQDLKNIRKSFKNVAEISFFIVESDSVDSTTKILMRESVNDEHFRFIALGNLKEKIPDRIERLRFCRNIYVDEIRNSVRCGKKWDYILVTDLDGVNSALTQKSIKSCFEKVDWDACFATQTFGYYDLYALRAEDCLENNCFTSVENELKNYEIKNKRIKPIMFILNFYKYNKIKKRLIYNKMVRLSRNGDWVKVISAFGGTALYKTKLFLEYNYDKIFVEPQTYSEHLDLNYKCYRSGAHLFINPKFINNHFNEYNLNRLFIIRFFRALLINFPMLKKILKTIKPNR